jgi:hypothetical protein
MNEIAVRYSVIAVTLHTDSVQRHRSHEEVPSPLIMTVVVRKCFPLLQECFQALSGRASEHL